MAKNKRFKKTYADSGCYVIVDNETGVNYLYFNAGYSGGLTPLLDKDGNVIVTPVTDE